ncbi:MAG: DNA repair protein RecO [Candidatus Omnitrophica bacterium]|nr:DNA repair protein RecO [Candidatus Omnitrophota bacterium]
MSAINCEAIILRRYFLRETSYILVFFTQEHGKISGVLKGARKPYPQFAGNFELFNLCDVSFYKKKRGKLDLVSTSYVKKSFLNLRKNILRLTYANYIIELVDIVTVPGDKNEELYRDLLAAFNLISDGASPRRITRIFELKLLKSMGVEPGLESCFKCGKEESDFFHFIVPEGIMICSSCGTQEAGRIRVSNGCVSFMRKALTSPFEQLKNIKVSKLVGEETERILKSFIEFHLGRKTKTEKFLKTLQTNTL